MSLARILEAAQRLRVQFALIIAVAMAPAGLVAVIQASSNIEEAIRLEEDALRKVARADSEDERAAVVALRERMRLAARSPDLRAMGGSACDAALERLVANDERFTGALVLDAEGRAVCGERKDVDLGNSDVYRSYLQAPRQLVGPVRVGKLSGRNMMMALSPIKGLDDRLGILAMGIATSVFEMAPETAANPKMTYGLVDQAGKVFAQNMSETRDWVPASIDRLLGETEIVVHEQGQDGAQRIYYIAPMPIEKMWLVAARPQLTWGEVLLSSRGLSFVAPLLLWAIAVAVAFFVIDRLVSRHITYLQRVAAAIGRGHLEIGSIRLDGAPSEIKRLGAALEQMAGRLAEREAALRANVDQKRALLLEVHHRVKNNLQMISSLMNMQLRRVKGREEREAIRILQDRIHGLALVHQNLYAAEKFDAIALNRLVRDLVEHLRESLCPQDAKIAVEYDLAAIESGTETATPVSLFVVEAVANSFKHSFGAGARGTLRIGLRRLGEEEFELIVGNESEGQAKAGLDNADETEASGLGSRLMEGFAKQIGGRIERRVGQNWYEVALRAPLSPRSRGFALRHRDRMEEGGRTSEEVISAVQ